LLKEFYELDAASSSAHTGAKNKLAGFYSPTLMLVVGSGIH
jgi:hypothetical protein